MAILNGYYNKSIGTASFSTTHFSGFAIAFNPVYFKDVSGNAWYSKAVSFIAARGITSGTGNGNFSPDDRFTRGAGDNVDNAGLRHCSGHQSGR